MLGEIDAYLREVARYFQSKLDSSLCEAYKLGSLAHGGFSFVYSDLDVGLLLQCREPPARMDHWIAEAKTHPEFGKKLSIFWGNPELSWGRLPMIDRLDLLDHGKPLLHGRKPDFRRPTAEEIHSEQLQSIDKSWRGRLPELRGLSRLDRDDRKPFIRALLYPARLIYTWDNLVVGSNDQAVAYLKSVRPAGLDLRVIEKALACRHGDCSAEEVFALAPDFDSIRKNTLRYLGIE